MPQGQFTEADILPGKGQFTDADIAPATSLDSRTRGTMRQTKPGTTLRQSATDVSNGLPFGIGSFIASPVAGAASIGEGFERMGQDKTGSGAGGISDVLRGGFQAMTPSMPGAAASMGPLKFAASLGLGVGSASLTEQALKAAGVPDGYAELAGTLAGGYAAAKGPGAVKSGATQALEAIKANGGKISPKVAREVGTGLGAILGGKLGGGVGVLGGGYIGRKAGGYLGKVLADRIIPGTPEAPAIPPIYDQIAQGLGAKDYASAGPVAQAVIEKLAATASAKAATPPVTRTAPPAAAPSAPVSTAAPAQTQSLAQQIDAEIAARKAAAAPLQTAGPQLPVNIPATSAEVAPQPVAVYGIRGAAQSLADRIGQETPVPKAYLDPEASGIQGKYSQNQQRMGVKIGEFLHKKALESGVQPEVLDQLKQADPASYNLFWKHPDIEALSSQPHYAPSEGTQDIALTEWKRLNKIQAIKEQLKAEMEK